MHIHNGIEENLRFLILEVKKQLERTKAYIDNPTLELLDLVLSRDDYVDNLKSVIQRKCFSSAAQGEDQDPAALDALKAVNVVAANLERIADFCEKIIRQLTYVEDEEILRHYEFDDLFREVIDGVLLVPEAVIAGDVKVALSICRIEHRIDEIYAAMFRNILNDLKTGEHTQSLVTILFIARYLERMGDSLLNIGEAAVSAFLGEGIKIEQLDTLERSLAAADLNPRISDLSLAAVGETKSGCRIDLVSTRSESDGATMVIFKEGERKKMEQEKAGVDYWDALVPGIAPTIYAHRSDGKSAALLFEYLDGETFEKLLLSGTDTELTRALSRLGETLSSVWLKTRRNAPASLAFSEQIRKRLNDVYAVHPSFANAHGALAGVEISSFEGLLDKVAGIETKMNPPCAVLVHGDFNIDNIIFDAKSDRIRFIDLHRSSLTDYVQDISVFLVSNFRLQAFDAPVRRRINRTIRDFHAFTAEFADGIGDETFEIRLALGLARSFVTSTRFVLDTDFARRMLLRSRYLIESVADLKPHEYGKFTVPPEVMVD
jgi:phosphate uptake regulator/aminoglycoside phosphotransferase